MPVIAKITSSFGISYEIELFQNFLRGQRQKVIREIEKEDST